MPTSQYPLHRCRTYAVRTRCGWTRGGLLCAKLRFRRRRLGHSRTSRANSSADCKPNPATHAPKAVALAYCVVKVKSFGPVIVTGEPGPALNAPVELFNENTYSFAAALLIAATDQNSEFERYGLG